VTAPQPSAESVLPLAAADLACYAAALLPSFELAKHIELLVEKLEAVERGKIRRLLVAEPPRHGKSLLTCQLLPAWYLGRHPERSLICATYGQDLSDDFGRRVRNLLSDPLHQAIFPACRLSPDSTSLRRFDTTRGGSYYAVGRGGPITGRGADLLILDDTLKDREEARSETIRRNLHEWFSSVAFTRLTPNGAIVLIATRWHEDDLTGWLLREHAEEGWELLNLPAIAEASDPLGRTEGEALWPSRYPLDALESIRRQIGGAAFASLYQGRPAAAEGCVFRRAWFRTFRDLPTSIKRIVQSWDTAFKTGAENDFSVCTTWAFTDSGYFLLSLWRGRVEFPELKRQVANQADQWKPHAILVEDKASGQSLIQELKLATNFPVLPIKVDSDKRARAEAVTPLFEAGRVFLPESANWLNDLEDELTTFPVGAHDDIVDSITQALNYLREQPSSSWGLFKVGMVDRGAGELNADLWDKIARNEPLTEEEFDRL
jgi:predicted phage terminase large subunit-like protein